MSTNFFVPNPGGDFMRWASVLCEELSAYNPPNPVSEGSWRDWAIQLFAIPELVGLGVSDPRGFSSWRGWATNLIQAAM